MATSLGLYLMGQKGLESLQALCETTHRPNLAFVVGARDAAMEQDYYDEIRACCLQYGIAHFDRTKLPELPATTYNIAIAWRWLILPPDNLIVFHDSLLPKYRGFNPLVTALIEGDTEIGVSALFANAEFDRGDLIGQERCTVTYPLRIQEAIAEVSGAYRCLLLRLSATLYEGRELVGQPQNESEASYSLWRDDEDYLLDWSLPAEVLARTVDAVGFPYKGAQCFLNGERVFVRAVRVLPDVLIANRCAGKVVFVQEEGPVVVCGTGLLQITQLEDAQGQSVLPLKKFRSRFT